MSTPLPALTLMATPRRARTVIDLCREAEERGFAGIYSPSLGDAMGLCQALATETKTIRFGTSIVNMHTRHPGDYARSAAFIHELAEGRFDFGVGVSHDPINEAMGLRTGRPIADTRRFVEAVRNTRGIGELPPIIIAALRDPMVRLAGEIANGLVFANAALSRTEQSLATLPKTRADNFFIGNMIPVCVTEDLEAGAARNRKTMAFYLTLPNYRLYWKAAGFETEMENVERGIEAGEKNLPALAGDRWLADCTVFGPPSHVRDRVDAWRAAGVTTPILVPSSVEGNQAQAVREIFAVYE